MTKVSDVEIQFSFFKKTPKVLNHVILLFEKLTGEPFRTEN